MLSPATIRTINGWLLAAATEPFLFTDPPTPAERSETTTPADHVDGELLGCGLLTLHDGEASDAPPDSRCMSAVTAAIDPDLVGAYPGGVVDLLADLATATPAAEFAAETLTGLFTAPKPGTRVVACAVTYDDIHTSGCADEQGDPDVRVVMARRVDAVDIDGRVYQAVRIWGRYATVFVDDQPDPLDTPATHAGLTALLATAAGWTAHSPADGG
jgi:hypothetical protein